MLPPQPTPVAPPRATTWRIILREVKAAPKQARRAIVISALGLDVGLALAVYDLLTGTNPEEIQRLIALFLAVAGALFLVIAQVLHQVSQGLECSVGFPTRYTESTGLGNLRQRLKTLYGATHEFSIDSSAVGSRITIILPAQI